MKNIVFILKTSLKILKARTLPVLIVMVLMLTFGQVATAQNESFRIKGKEAKEYFVEKYKLKKSQVRSEIQQTPNGPKGKLYFGRDTSKGSTLKVPIKLDIKDRENRARAIAKSFIKEEADLFGITNMDEIREVRINTSKGRNGDFTMIRYHRFINGLQFDNAYIWITVGPDDDVTIVQAELVPASPELYEAVKKKTLSETDIKKIVEDDLKIVAQSPETDPIAESIMGRKKPQPMDLKKVAISSPPYVVWKVISVWVYTINAFTGEILERVPNWDS